MKSKVKKIGILTGGGDCPGLNAVIRGVTKPAQDNGMSVYGIIDGFEGLVEGKAKELKNEDVSGILARGGTILGSSNKGDPFHWPTSRDGKIEIINRSESALRNYQAWGLDALIAIGGDGTMHICNKLGDMGMNIIGVPKTIDNDLDATDLTFGHDSAVYVVSMALDRLHTTASSHHRVIVVEVMGRDAGFIALRSGIAVGAEAILVPETKTYIEHLLERIEKRRASKGSAIVIVSEGDDFGGAEKVVHAIKERYENLDVKLTRLGHIQRGGNPSAMDRVLASFLGAGAIDAFLENKFGIMIGMQNKKVVHVPLEKAIKHHQSIDENLLKLAEMLSI